MCKRKKSKINFTMAEKMGHMQNIKKLKNGYGWCWLSCVQNFLMALLWCRVYEYSNLISFFSFRAMMKRHQRYKIEAWP